MAEINMITSPDKDMQYIHDQVLVDCRDTETNVPGKGCSDDNGAHYTVIANADGLMFHQKDAVKITNCLTFDHLTFKSPDGTAFYLSVSNDGQPVITKVKKEDDSQ